MRRDASRLDLIDGAAAALLVVMLTAAAYVGVFGPTAPVPLHFDLHGRPDRWGSPAEAALVLAALAGLLGAVHVTLSAAYHRHEDVGMRRTFGIGRTSTLIVFALVGALMIALATGRLYDPLDPRRAPTIVVGLLAVIFVCIGAVLGKARPNPYLGVRVYWTFASRLAWDKANRLLGRIYFLGGLAILLLLPQLTTEASLLLTLGVGVGGALAATFESWRVWRADPDRAPDRATVSR